MREQLASWGGSISERHGARTLLVLALIVVVGFGLRAHRALDPLDNPGDDARAYFSLSKSLYVDGTYGGPTFHDASDWSPGAPLLYAGVYYLTGGVRDGAARMLLALIGAVSVVAVYLLGRRLAGGGAGLLAASGAALYPAFDQRSDREADPDQQVLGADQRRQPEQGSRRQPGRRRALLAGPEEGQHRGWQGKEGGRLGEQGAVGVDERRVERGTAGREQPGATAGAAFLVPIIPWTIHNLVSVDRFVPISTGGGKALYVGTALSADGDYQRVKAELVQRYQGRSLEPGSPQLDAVNPTPLFNRVAAEHPDLSRDSSLGRIGKHQLYENLQHHPAGYAAMLARKTARMWDHGVAMSGPLGRAVQLLLLALGLFALATIAARRRWWELAAYAIPVALITAIGAVSLASTRRNEVLMSLVIPLAAAGVVWAVELVRKRAGRRAASTGPAADA